MEGTLTRSVFLRAVAVVYVIALVSLWTQAEALFGAQGLLPAPDYLERVVGRLNPEGMADNPEITYRVHVVDDPTLNAFAFPHGSLYVHTGLLTDELLEELIDEHLRNA